MKPQLLFCLPLLAAGTVAQAAPRASTDYSITTDALDFGGLRTTSTDYTQDGSAAAIGGSSTASPTMLVHHGFIGQLYELLGYGLLATDFYPPEEGTTQLIPVRTADDGTNVVIPTTGFTFGVVSGPLTGVSPTGLVTAGTVSQDSAAEVSATSGDFVGELRLPLFVQDTLPDNFGTYARDGIPDSWQNQYFGLDNPLAAPGLDPDGDGQNNLFEFTAGLVPTDLLSRFLLRIEPVPGQPARQVILFSPRFADRSYEVRAATTLAADAWEPLESNVTTDDGQVRAVTDLDASQPRKFYRVEITNP